MKRVLNFLALLAMGLLIAGLIAVVVSGPAARLPSEATLFDPNSGESAFALDTKSLLIGIAAGWLLSILMRVSWVDLPARTVAWLMRNERNFLRFGMAGAFVAVLFFY